MIFRDRMQAGKMLADKLLDYKNKDCVIYALPRGGVVVGYEIAKILNLPLDLVISRKVGHPNDPEFAVCAVTEYGQSVCDESEVESIDKKWLENAMEKEKQEAKRRREEYMQCRESINPKGKIAIITDDGIATGLTMKVAIQTIKAMEPKEIIIAVPVAPNDVTDELKQLVDKVIVLDNEYFLGSVGASYEEFKQVSDEEVIWLLDSLSLSQKESSEY